MKNYFSHNIIVVFLFVLCSNLYSNNTITNKSKTKSEPLGKDNIAYKWGQIALVATANDTEKFKPRPTVTSRYLGLTFVAIFDAWSRYDKDAIPVYLNTERRPDNEQILKNKEIAISYAAFGALSEYYFSDKQLFASFMVELGLDPNNKSLDPTTPEGIGNLAAKAVIEARKHDGANQYGEENGSNGTPYFDYSVYKPVNSPDEMIDVNHWQPKYFSDGKGGKFAPGCLTPFWNKVKPVGLQSGGQFRPGPPPSLSSKQLKNEVKEVIDLQFNLTNEQKALVEFMRDGPKSVQQAGHWLKFAQEVSIRDNHSLDQDVKMYFLNQVTAMDCFIACWDTKMFYDFARPYALVHYYFKDQTIKAWGGPGFGNKEMKGQDWRPYSPDVFLCPSFPGYVSGHSTISGGCAEALKLWTGSDTFGSSAIWSTPGSMTEPNNIGKSVELKFPTFTETANMAGISRVMGGYHIQSDNVEGLKLGRNVAHEVWKFYNIHIGNKTIDKDDISVSK
ncbi:vanadium-dependent haloperoxidase [Flavobacterium sp.]|uniref:vanadium-dependent haloperoxidase n=1 Tax=Flavobacterium sp. TaxID=239 RepID=UPI002BB98142|nr:vanadium-dependent haloperoxidase [Flavobacterium sp.]HSD07679.1 vanadium-dependent haloperoxidase [Flavobacterium sp.]